MSAPTQQRKARPISRATNDNIVDVFRRAGDGAMALRHAIEELIARSTTVELTNGVSIPTAALLDNVNDHEIINRADFINFVTVRINASAGRGDSLQATRYVSASEYLSQCIRCSSGQADEFGVTRYWRGLPRMNPRVSLGLVVIITTVCAMACVMGVLFGLSLPVALDEAESTNTALAESLQSAITSVMGAELPAQLSAMKAVGGNSPNTVLNTYIQAFALALTTAVNEVNLILYDANHLYEASVLNRVSQLNITMLAAIEAMQVMNMDGATFQGIMRTWVAAGRGKLRGAVWFDITSGDGLPRTVLSSWGSALCGVAAPSGLCALLSNQASLKTIAAQHTVLRLWTNTTNNGSNLQFYAFCNALNVDTASYTNTILCGVERSLFFDEVRMPEVTVTYGSALNCNLAVSNTTGGWYQLSSSMSLRAAPSDLATRATVNAAQSVFSTESTLVGISAAFTVPYCGQSQVPGCKAYAECSWNVTRLTADGSKQFNTIYGSGFKVTVTVWDPVSELFIPLDGSTHPDPVWSPEYQLSQSDTTPYGTVTGLNEIGLPTVAAFADVPYTPYGIVVETVPQVSTRAQSVAATLAQVLGTSLPSGHDIAAFVDTVESGLRVVDKATGAPDVTLPVLPHAAVDAARSAFYSRRRRTVRGGGTSAVAVYVAEINAVVVAYTDTTATTLDLMKYTGYASIAAVVLLLLVIVVLERVARTVLDVAQADSSSNGTAAADSAEHHAQVSFGALLQDAMPPMYLERFKGGEKLISDFHPTLTFFFSDIVKFTEKTKFMSMTDIVRFLGYTFWLLDTVAEYYDIHKVKSIGDAFFAVSGLEDAENRRRNGGANVVTLAQNHQTYRMLAFGSVCQMLLTQNFFHLPEKTEFFAAATGTSAALAVPLKPPPIRIGIHVGPAYAGVFDAGRAPQFDCIGSAIGVCAMLEAAALPGTIRISDQCRKLLNQIDTQKDFICSEPQKTLAKNQGRVETFTIVATFIGVPQAILETLNVTRSLKKRTFGDGGFQLDEVDKGFKEITVFGDFEHSQMQSESSDDENMGGDEDA